MLFFISISLSLFTLLLSNILNKKVNNPLNPCSIMVYIWLLLLFIAVTYGSKLGYYPVDISVILFTFFFLDLILIITYFGSETINNNYKFCIDFSEKKIFNISIVLFLFFLFSTFCYFKNLSNYIPLNNLLSNIWLWKDLELSGKLSSNSLLFLGRNLQLIGTILAIGFLNCTGYRKKTIFVFLIVYLLLTFIDPRRDPIIDKLIYIICPFVLYYKGNIKQILKWVIPLSIIFIITFFILSSSLSFGKENGWSAMGAYTFASFNSLQKAIDTKFTSRSELVLGNTFYFIYMILKFINPILTPPNIVLNFLGGSDTVNIYTSLIAPYLDSNGNLFVFVILIVIYALYIGVVIAISINISYKKRDFSAMIFSSAVYACAIRSFYNPTFSYAEILVSIIYIILMKTIFEKRAKKIERGFNG